MAQCRGTSSRPIGWGKRLIAAGVIVLLTGSPASNEVRCFTDRQGTIHITNITPKNQGNPPENTLRPDTVPLLKAAASQALYTEQDRSGFQPPPSHSAPIRRVQTPEGVIRITNQAPKTKGEAPEGVSEPPSGKRLALAAHKDTGGGPESAAVEAGPATGAGVQVRQETGGKIQIKNNPQIAAASDRSGGAAGGPGTPGGLPPPVGVEGGTGVTVSRDSRGVLRVRSAASLSLGVAQQAPTPGRKAVSPELEAIMGEAAEQYNLPVSLIRALVEVESNFVPGAVSPKGAQGLMQLMPATADFLGVKNPFCPRENILAGCRYFRLLLDFFRDSLPLALAAYNAGYPRVIKAGYKVPDITETQNFVTQVLGRYLAHLKRMPWPWSGKHLR